MIIVKFVASRMTSKEMKTKLELLVVVVLLICAAAFSQTLTESPHSIQCAAGEFRGIGLAKTENEALREAHSIIADSLELMPLAWQGADNESGSKITSNAAFSSLLIEFKEVYE